MEFGKKQERKWDPICILWVVHFVLIKFLRRDGLRIWVPFLLPVSILCGL